MQAIEQQFQSKVCEQVRLVAEGGRRYRVLTPFRFADGDHLSVVLKQTELGWILSDEGHTYLHLTYEIDESDLSRGTRQEIISNALSAFDVDDVQGELSRVISDGEFGDALYSYLQALLKITDVTFLTRERVRSTFIQDVSTFIMSFVPQERVISNWHDPVRDPEGQYAADYRVNGMKRPLMVYALQNDDRTRDATISLLKFENWRVPFQSLGVFEDQEAINRKVLARFTDVADKQFSSLPGNRERIRTYIENCLADPA